MSLIRILIIVSVCIALIPSDKAEQERFQQSAIDMAYWTLTFCDRNRQTCEIIEAAWGDFKQKAQFAFDLGQEVLIQNMVSTTKPEIPNTQNPPKSKKTFNTGSLKPSDIAPEWRNSQTRSDIKVGISLPSR